MNVTQKIAKYLTGRKTPATLTEIVNALKINHNTARRILGSFRFGANKRGYATYAVRNTSRGKTNRA